LDPPDNRRVKQPLRAWKTDLPAEAEPIRQETIVPIGESAEIEPFEEIRVLRWIRVGAGTMALVSWRDALYLVAKDDLEERTMRVFRAGR
jgi:hypothetical protein